MLWYGTNLFLTFTTNVAILKERNLHACKLFWTLQLIWLFSQVQLQLLWAQLVVCTWHNFSCNINYQWINTALVILIKSVVNFTWQACTNFVSIATSVVSITTIISPLWLLWPCKSYNHTCSWVKNPRTLLVKLIFLQDFFLT